MMRELPPLASRLTALGILIALIAVAWLAVARPVIDRYAGYRETVTQAEENLPRLNRLAVMAPMLESRIASLRRNPSARRRELSGATDALAAADLQNRVSSVAGRHKVVLRSTQILQPAEEEGFRRIGIRIAMEGNTATLHKIFYALESSPTLMFLDNVEIRSRSGGRVRRKANGASAPEDILTVRFDLFGYTRAGKS